MTKIKSTDILNFLKAHSHSSSKEIFDGINSKQSYATIKRLLTKLLNENQIIINGTGKASKYSCSPHYQIFYPIDVNQYFEKEIDERIIQANFNLELMEGTLGNINIFNPTEIAKLDLCNVSY